LSGTLRKFTASCFTPDQPPKHSPVMRRENFIIVQVSRERASVCPVFLQSERSSPNGWKMQRRHIEECAPTAWTSDKLATLPRNAKIRAAACHITRRAVDRRHIQQSAGMNDTVVAIGSGTKARRREISWARPDPYLLCGLLCFSRKQSTVTQVTDNSSTFDSHSHPIVKRRGPQNSSERVESLCGPAKGFHYEQSRIPRQKARVHPPI